MERDNSVLIKWVFALLFCLFSVISVHAEPMDDAKNWLSVKINSGLLSSDLNSTYNALALDYQAAKESVIAMDHAEASAMLDRQMLLLPFSTLKESNTTEYLSAFIIAHTLSGDDTSTYMQTLLGMQHADGGFGTLDTYVSSPLDTALALEAFGSSPGNAIQIESAINYLLAWQKDDGSWQITEEDKLYTTAVVLRALWLHRKSYNVQVAIEQAKSYLIAQKHTDGSYGSETFETALVLRSIAPLTYEKSTIQDTIDYLYALQQPSGSWEEDIYTTALVIDALAAADMPVPNPDLSALSGTVVDAESNLPLEGIEVRLIADQNLTVVTASNGGFFFEGLKNGTYTLLIADSNYALLQTTLHFSGEDIDLGTIRLNKNTDATVSTVTGIVKDAETGEPVEGAAISLGDYETMTDVSGSYTIASIEPGQYTIQVFKEGYALFEQSVDIPSNTILRYNMTLYSITYISASITGTVVDKNNSLPLRDVNITLMREDTQEAWSVLTGDDGRFGFDKVAAGAYRLTIAKEGYAALQSAFEIRDSSRVDFGVIELAPVDDTSSSYVSVQGVIKDAVSKTPIEGAVVTASGLTSVTQPDGSYLITDIPAGEVTVSVFKDGYTSTDVTLTLQGGTRLVYSPLLQKDNGVRILYGTITDANTSEPLADVNVFIVDTNLTVFTDINGSYVLEDIPQGEIIVEVSKQGYATLKVRITVEDDVVLFSPSLQSQQTQQTYTTLYGRIVDTTDEMPLAGVEIYLNGIDSRIQSDAEGNFAIPRIETLETNLTFKKDGYKDIETVLMLSTHQTVDIGTLHMRPITAEMLRSDLMVEAINTSGLLQDISSLHVSGELNVTVVNRGTVPSEPFALRIFYDSNADGNYTSGVDRVVAETRVEEELAVDASSVITVSIDTIADFREQPIYVLVDAYNENIELDENNTYSTAKSCGGKQGRIDLGVCFDYSGSVGSLANIQKEGLVQALLDPKKFPRDGSIRLTIMTATSRTYLEPTIITENNVEDVAYTLKNTYFYGNSYVDDCLRYMADKLTGLEEQSTYKAVTLSGDGRWGSGITSDRDYAVAKGINVIDAIGTGSLNWNTLNQIVYPQPAGGDLGVVRVAQNAEDISNSLFSAFQQQTQIADITVGKLQIVDNGSDVNISVRFVVGNAGVATVPSDINISVYEGDPANGGILLAKVSLDENLTFDTFRVMQIDNLALQEGGSIVVIADEANRLVECTKDNNRIDTVVTATTTMGNISVRTDKTRYGANEAAMLFADIVNPGRLSYELVARLTLTDTSGHIVQTFAPHALGVVASKESRTVYDEWNTTDTLAGTYLLKGELLDKNGVVVDETEASFLIVAGDAGVPDASLILQLDGVRYRTTDRVGMMMHVQNLSDNGAIDDVGVYVKVTDGGGTVVHTYEAHLGTLLPNASRDVPYMYGYEHLLPGTYRIEALLQDADGKVYATDTKRFEVYEDFTQAYKGSITVAWHESTVGTAQTCRYSVSNFGATPVSRLPVTIEVIDLSSGLRHQDVNRTVDLNVTQTVSGEIPIDTHGYTIGEHACVLYVEEGVERVRADSAVFAVTNTPPEAVDDSVQTYRNESVLVDVLANDSDVEDGTVALAGFEQPAHGMVVREGDALRYTPETGFEGTDSFEYNVTDTAGAQDRATVFVEVLPPPIEMRMQIVQKPTGRMLVLVDPCSGDKGCGLGCACGDMFSFRFGTNDGVSCEEPNGPEDAVGVDEQALYALHMLKKLGLSVQFSYDNPTFLHALQSGGFNMYAILSETVRLDTDTQRILREFVFGGENMLIAGMHDHRNALIDTLLDVRYGGWLRSVETVETDDENLSYLHTPLLDRSFPVRLQNGSEHLLMHYNLRHCFSSRADAAVEGMYGKGKMIVAGFDLLAEAASAPEEEFSVLFEALVRRIGYDTADQNNSALVGVEITLFNDRMATPAEVTVYVDGGEAVDAPDANESNGTTVRFIEPMMEEASEVRHRLWIHRNTEEMLVVKAEVYSLLDGERKLQTQAQWQLEAQETVEIARLIDDAKAIELRYRLDRIKLKRAIYALERAVTYRQKAQYVRMLRTLLDATDRLESIKEKEKVRPLREAVGGVIKAVSRIVYEKGEE